MKSEARSNRERELVRKFLDVSHVPIIGDIVETEALREAFLLGVVASQSDMPTLIRGETGTGKELMAKAIWLNSDRADKTLVVVDCSNIAEQLALSTLFGHVRGAFTGADKDKEGLFHIADGSTIFLDEFCCLSPACQKMILRVIETGEVRRLGDNVVSRVDVKVIAASSNGLYGLGLDLYGRFIYHIEMPPLRERVHDIPILVGHFADGIKFSERAMKALQAHRWPMNIRELKLTIERAKETAALFELKEIHAEDLIFLPSLVAEDASPIYAIAKKMCDDEECTLDSVTEDIYRKVYALCGGDPKLAGEMLDVTSKTVRSYLRREEE